MRAFVVDGPSSGALRALNYSPTVERIRRAGSSSARPLHELVKTFGPGWRHAFARLNADPEHGVELLSQSDVFAAEPRGRWIRQDSMSEPWRHRIEPGQVLLAGTGTLAATELYGRAVLADSRLIGKFLTEDAMALVFESPEDDFSLFTYAWLASPTGVQVLRSTSYGTKMLRFRKELLTTLPVPLAPGSLVSRVADLVRSAARARAEFVVSLGSGHHIDEDEPGLTVHRFGANKARKLFHVAMGRFDERSSSRSDRESTVSAPSERGIVALVEEPGEKHSFDALRASLVVGCLPAHLPWPRAVQRARGVRTGPRRPSRGTPALPGRSAERARATTGPGC